MSQWVDLTDSPPTSRPGRPPDALRPHTVDKVHVNNLAGDEAGAVRDACGPNRDRLVAVKRRYDRDNVARLNTNIDPG